MTYYDKEGNEIDLMDWADRFEDMEYRYVGKDEINGYIISTIWIGADFLADFIGQAPLLFETMIFNEKDSELGCFMEKYATLEQALNGHKKAVEMVKQKRKYEKQ